MNNKEKCIRERIYKYYEDNRSESVWKSCSTIRIESRNVKQLENSNVAKLALQNVEKQDIHKEKEETEDSKADC